MLTANYFDNERFDVKYFYSINNDFLITFLLTCCCFSLCVHVFASPGSYVYEATNPDEAAILVYFSFFYD